MIPTTTDTGPFGGLEHCAICRAITHHWTALPDRAPGEQVACCEGCAKSKTPGDVPTKDAWCVAEKRASGHVRRVTATTPTGRRGNKPGTKGANWPEAERGTRKVGWRLTPDRIAAVKDLADDLHEPEGLVAAALLEVGARHLDEVKAAIRRRTGRVEGEG